MSTAFTLKKEITEYAREIGIDLIGITDAAPFDRLIAQLKEREPHYRERYSYRIDTWNRMATPRDALPGAKSVIVLGFYYLTADAQPSEPSGRMGRIVTYGHLGILKRARQMRDFLEKRGYKALMGAHRKEAAMRAGLGFVGKHNLVINPEYGSWVAYQSIVTDAELPPDEPFSDDLCKDCDKCLKACPTGALYEARKLDPRKCVTYMLTSKDVPKEHWPHMDNYILGCDACQDGCPRNAGLIPKQNVESLLPAGMGSYPPLNTLLQLDEAAFQKEIIGFIQQKISSKGIMASLMMIPLMRKAAAWFTKTFMAGREVLPETFVHASGNLSVYKRNALIAIGNQKAVSLRKDAEAYVNDPYLGKYAQWAVSQMESEHGR